MCPQALLPAAFLSLFDPSRQLGLFFGIVSIFYVLYSIHAGVRVLFFRKENPSLLLSASSGLLVVRGLYPSRRLPPALVHLDGSDQTHRVNSRPPTLALAWLTA